MSHHRQTWFAAFLFMIGAFLSPSVTLSAGEKKQDEKKKDEKKAPVLFEKKDALTEKDAKDTKPLLAKSPRKVYPIKMTEGKTYQIHLASKDFDAVLRLENPASKEVAFNDDFDPPALDSRIIYRATATGEYKIIATSLTAKPGKFILTVTDASGLTTASMFKNKPIALKAKDGKARYTGELIEQDGLVFNHYYKVFTLQLEAGKTYRIDHQSGDFDAYLFLEDPAGNKLAEDDDSGGGINACIVHKAARTGLYRIIATTLPARKTGKFVLEIAVDDAKPEKQSRLPPRDPPQSFSVRAAPSER